MNSSSPVSSKTRSAAENHTAAAWVLHSLTLHLSEVDTNPNESPVAGVACHLEQSPDPIHSKPYHSFRRQNRALCVCGCIGTLDTSQLLSPAFSGNNRAAFCVARSRLLKPGHGDAFFGDVCTLEMGLVGQHCRRKFKRPMFYTVIFPNWWHRITYFTFDFLPFHSMSMFLSSHHSFTLIFSTQHFPSASFQFTALTN